MARLYLCWKLFYEANPSTTLMTTRYAFERSDLQVLAARFFDGLREWDRTMPVRRYVPLDTVTPSIQY